jgi:uncharacterized integral membrane protein (TIGR00698 family)
MAVPAARTRGQGMLPGIALAILVALGAHAAARLQQTALGHVVIEELVAAILLGMLVRSTTKLPAVVEPGIRFAGKEVLEVAVLLLGAGVDFALVLRAGPALAIGIGLLVSLSLVSSYAIGRAVGLPAKLAILVACGNSICGNSAIAAVAPVIDADREHVASAIAFTAAMGVFVVLGLPLLIAPLHLSLYQYGVVAGLTVYAVPQVLAATVPVGPLAAEVGTLVKLVRVLMLGPVVGALALVYRGGAARMSATSRRPGSALFRYVPWFIAGFLLLATLRSLGVITATAAAETRTISTLLTTAAMAALGLGVDLRAVARVGRGVILAVSGSIVALLVAAVALVRVLGIG